MEHEHDDDILDLPPFDPSTFDVGNSLLSRLCKQLTPEQALRIEDGMLRGERLGLDVCLGPNDLIAAFKMHLDGAPVELIAALSMTPPNAAHDPACECVGCK